MRCQSVLFSLILLFNLVGFECNATAESAGAIAFDPAEIETGLLPEQYIALNSNTPDGTKAVSWRYEFSASSGTYTEIAGGTVHGTASNDDQSYNAISLGFTFIYDGVPYTTISIQNNGFIAMGDTVASSYLPISGGTTNNVIVALGRDLQGNGTTSELMSLMEGTEPNRVFTVQWKNYKRYGSGYVGDDLDFQIKLYEDSGDIEIVYGTFLPLVGSAASTIQVGLRGASTADFNNLMTDATHLWDDPLAGTINTSTMTLSDVIYPASGQTYTWSLFIGVAVSGGDDRFACPGEPVVYDITVFNATGAADTFNLSYSSAWPISGPSATGVIANENSETFQVTVEIPWSATEFEIQPFTVTATDPTSTYTDSTSGNTIAHIISGTTDLTSSPAGRGVRWHSVVYWDGKLYKIGGDNGAAQAWLDIYDIATDSWTQGPDMPAARMYIDCVAINGKIYCAGGYNSGGQDDLYIYDIAAGSWSTSPTLMPANRYHYEGVALDGKYYVIGGYTTSYAASMIVYNPSTDSWDSTLPAMSVPRRYFHAGVIGGKIYVAGGYNGAYLTTGEVFDPAVPGWSSINMGFNWCNGADGVIQDRYLVLIGGYTGGTATASPFGLLYDSVSDAWFDLPVQPHTIYGGEADSDGNNFWYASGRLYEGSVWSYSTYLTHIDECGSCEGLTNADFTVDPVIPQPGIPATFSGSVASGSPPITYDWDFGDGEYGAGQTVVHTYAASGTYTVTMTATNCDGSNSDDVSHDVSVSSGPLISVDPTTLDSTQCPNAIGAYAFSICNEGDQPLTWSCTDDSAWLSEDPVSGTLAAGDCQGVLVTFDSSGLAPGTYNGILQVDSNDPTNPTVNVPATLIVASGPTNADFTWDPVSPELNETTIFNGTADSLVPVDFSWDFGDGGTATGQSVTHAYVTAGDYTVTMTAAACGNTSVASHTVTVQDCWTVLDEDFEDTFPPAGWTVINNGGTCEWLRNDAFATARPNYAGGDGFCADADSDKCGSGTTMDTELRTMPLNFGGFTTVMLDYVTSYNDIASGGDLADVDISTDGGTSWTNLLRWDEDHSASGPGEAVYLDLTYYAGETNVMIRFHYYVATYDWWWEVDQVRIRGCYVAGAVPDIEITPLVLSQNLYPDQTADQTFNIANAGLEHLNWTLDEGCGTPVSWLDLDPLGGDLPVGGDVDVTVSFDSAGLSEGTYTSTVCVNSDDPDEPQVIVDVTLIIDSPPLIEVTPGSLSTEQCYDQVTMQQIEICNTGGEPLTWHMLESNPTTPIKSRRMTNANTSPITSALRSLAPVSSQKCTTREETAGIDTYKISTTHSHQMQISGSGNKFPNFPTDMGYALDIGYVSDNFVSFQLNDFSGQTVIGPNADAIYGMDFDPTATTLYALNDTTDQLGTIDLSTGVFTGLVSCPPGGGAANWTGMSIDPVDGSFWACTATDLYSIDPVTGVSTLIGPFNAGSLMIEIAINAMGEMYGHDIGTDSIYSIDKATGSSTLIGPTGYAANYAQGMDFDNSDGTLYIFIYIGSGQNVYGTVDLNTGTVTPLSANSPQGEFEGAVKVAGDVSWISESLISGTIPPGECVTVDVTFDSTGLIPGSYTADLIIISNDPYDPQVTVPVSMTVLMPVDGAEFTWLPVSPEVGQVVSFTGTFVEGDPPVDFTWDWDDGTTPGSGPDPTHIFDSPGEYLVTLTVSNICGSDAVEHIVTVIPASSTPTSTAIPTGTPTVPATETPIPTNTSTTMPTSTATNVPTNTSTAPPSVTPTRTPTSIPSSTATRTPTLPPSVTPTRTPTASPTSTPTNTSIPPTITPTSVPPSWTPTELPASPTATPIPPTPTPECNTLGVTLEMPGDLFQPGDTCWVHAHVCNNSQDTLQNVSFFAVLDLGGVYWFWPTWLNQVDYDVRDFEPGRTTVEIVPEFIWPDYPNAYSDAMFYSAMLNPENTAIMGDLSTWRFSWMP